MLKKILRSAGVVVLMAFSGAYAEVYDASEVGRILSYAESGRAVGQAALGNCYLGASICEGIPRDLIKARYWLEKAASQGYAESQHNLGVMYAHGDGGPQDYAKARMWYERAAAQGFAESQYNLGSLYYNGQGVRQNIKVAKEWYGRACNKGHQRACNAYRLLNQAGY